MGNHELTKDQNLSLLRRDSTFIGKIRLIRERSASKLLKTANNSMNSIDKGVESPTASPKINLIDLESVASFDSNSQRDSPTTLEDIQIRKQSRNSSYNLIRSGPSGS